MQITADFLKAEITKMEQQRNHAHEVAVASQAAVDVLQSLLLRLDLPEPEIPTFAELGLPDPQPVETSCAP